MAVFLKSPRSAWEDLEAMSRASTDILIETGAVISSKPIPADSLYETVGLMGEIHRDGLEF